MILIKFRGTCEPPTPHSNGEKYNSSLKRYTDDPSLVKHASEIQTSQACGKLTPF